MEPRGGLRRRGGRARRPASRARRRRRRSTPSTSSSGGSSGRPASPTRSRGGSSEVGIVGAGLMATQLATLFLRRLEVPVVLTDVDAGARRRGRRGDPRRARQRARREGRLARGQGALPRLDRRPRATGPTPTRAATSCSRRCSRSSPSSRRSSARSSEVVSPECLLVTNTSSLSVAAMAAGLEHPERVVGHPLLQPRRRAAARRGRPDAGDRRRDARDRVGRDAEARQARRAREGRAGVRRQPPADPPVDGAHAGARERQHVRGDGRGGAAARASRCRRRRCSRWSARGSRTTSSTRSTRRSPTASRSRRRSQALADGEIAVASRRATTADASTRSTSGSSRRSPTRRGRILDEGVVASAGRDRRLPDPRRRLPVLPRRDHAAPRPERASRSASRGRPLGDALTTSRLRPRIPRSLRGAATPARERRPRELPSSNGCVGLGSAFRGCCAHAGIHHQRDTRRPEPHPDLESRRAPRRAWAGEPFLHPGEDPEVALAPGTARRRALDDALAEIEAGRRTPSPRWKVRYGLMLGLERVLAAETPATASGHRAAPPPDRRARRDADRADRREPARAPRRTATATANGSVAELGRGGRARTRRTSSSSTTRRPRSPASPGEDPGAVAPLPLPPPDRVRARRSPPPASSRRRAHLGVLILTHRRLLVDQFHRDLTTEGYGDRLTDAIERGQGAAARPTRSRSRPTPGSRATPTSSRASAYQLVICDEAHTALGEKTSAAIRSFSGADLHRHDRDRAADREAGLRRLPGLGRRPAAHRRRAPRPDRAAALPARPAGRRDQLGADRRRRLRGARAGRGPRPPALNQAAASLYRDRFGTTPGIVYAAGVDHAYNLAQEFRAAGLKAEAVSGRTPPRELAETLAAYERGEINVLINALLLAEGWNSPRATVCMHLAPTASKRVYQQRIGRIMRTHPRKEAGIVVDFVPKGATHNERVVSLHSLLDSDFYREGARVTPAPRRRSQRRARRKLSPAPWLVPVTPDVAPPARRDPARVAARRPAASSTTTSSASGRRSPAARSASTSAPSSRGSSPRAGPTRARSRRSSPSAPPRTRTGACG